MMHEQRRGIGSVNPSSVPRRQGPSRPLITRWSCRNTKRTFYACRRMSILGGKADMQRTSPAKTDFDPNDLREHSRDLPIGLSHRLVDGNVVSFPIA